MSSGEIEPQSSAGHDILARYLAAYSRARRLTELERPWGLDDDGLEGLWLRLSEALTSDPEKLDRIVSNELGEEDREHIAAKLVPLIFALPFRDFPAEVRAIRSGPRLKLLLRRYHRAQSVKAKREPEPPPSTPNGRNKAWQEQPMGFLPAAMTMSFSNYLRRVLGFGEEEQRHVALVSSNGRRSRVRVTVLAHQRGLVIRFLEKLPSPVDR
jgi:hypothetical protein